MAYYNSRLAYELQLSRRVALENQLEYSRALQYQRLAEAKQIQYREIKEIQRIRQEEQFRAYQARKNAELLQAEDNLLKERLLRTEKQKQYEAFAEAQRRSRLVREQQLEAQQRILQQQQRKKTQALAASRRIQLNKKIGIKEEIQRQNKYILEEQQTQEKLQKELRQIDIQIGSIYDARDERKKHQLEELQKLDEKIFRLRQDLRGSKVRQVALEQQLSHLSKLIA